MSSSNKTSYLGLPQWELSDKPQMEDYNDAFQTIDANLAKKADSSRRELPLLSGFTGDISVNTVGNLVMLTGSITNPSESFSLEKENYVAICEIPELKQHRTQFFLAPMRGINFAHIGVARLWLNDGRLFLLSEIVFTPQPVALKETESGYGLDISIVIDAKL